MVADLCASERRLAAGSAGDPGRKAGSATALPLARPQRASDTPVADWRGFHLALRRAALAATQSGAPLSLLLLELAGPARPEQPSGANPVARRLAGVVAAEIGAGGALLRYADECFAVIMMETDLGAAITRAERIGRSLSSSVAREPAMPAIGVAQFRDDESLGHLIERAAEALGRAKSDGSLFAAAGPRARRRSWRGCEHCPCGLPAQACLCRRV